VPQWLPVPLGIVMTNVASCANDPPLLIWNYAETRLSLFFPFGKRFLLFLLSMGRLVLILIVTLYDSSLAIGILLLVIILQLFFETVLPNNERPKWEGEQSKCCCCK
jgi:hypothetical protein